MLTPWASSPAPWATAPSRAPESPCGAPCSSPGTNDVRESPALALSQALQQAGATITVHDPKAVQNLVHWPIALPGHLRRPQPTVEPVQINKGIDITDRRDSSSSDLPPLQASSKTPVEPHSQDHPPPPTPSSRISLSSCCP
ncbi:UDP binding domain-containing protein [Streptomyces narbonensis]|uniref:UDP binding domain-containing protein n=1 Tax=Streptomyces narbonensis TaxID=67333 RepID=UPI003F4CF647